MILKRIAEALRQQAWTTFAIEFVLVIAGVLIALAVDNWNEERLQSRETAVHTRNLLSDLVQHEAALAERRARLLARLEDTAALKARFASGVSEAVFADFVRNEFDPRLSLLPTADRSTFEMLLSTGRIGNFEADLARSIQSYYEREDLFQLRTEMISSAVLDLQFEYLRHMGGALTPDRPPEFMIVPEGAFRDALWESVDQMAVFNLVTMMVQLRGIRAEVLLEITEAQLRANTELRALLAGEAVSAGNDRYES